MYNDGTDLRDKPRLQVLQGFDGNNTMGLTEIAAPAASSGIVSGMVIRKDAQNKWIKAEAAFTGPLYFAWEDADQPDVLASGALKGLSSLGKYKLQTAQFDTTDTFTVGSAVSVGTGAKAGLLIAGNAAGAAATIGYVVEAPKSLAAVQGSGTYKFATDNNAANLDVLTIVTNYVAA